MCFSSVSNFSNKISIHASYFPVTNVLKVLKVLLRQLNIILFYILKTLKTKNNGDKTRKYCGKPTNLL